MNRQEVWKRELQLRQFASQMGGREAGQQWSVNVVRSTARMYGAFTATLAVAGLRIALNSHITVNIAIQTCTRSVLMYYYDYACLCMCFPPDAIPPRGSSSTQPAAEWTPLLAHQSAAMSASPPILHIGGVMTHW
jgi:hypothetical protein